MEYPLVLEVFNLIIRPIFSELLLHVCVVYLTGYSE